MEAGIGTCILCFTHHALAFTWPTPMASFTRSFMFTIPPLPGQARQSDQYWRLNPRDQRLNRFPRSAAASSLTQNQAQVGLL